jgi:hypothetical protein
MLRQIIFLRGQGQSCYLRLINKMFHRKGSRSPTSRLALVYNVTLKPTSRVYVEIMVVTFNWVKGELESIWGGLTFIVAF